MRSHTLLIVQLLQSHDQFGQGPKVVELQESRNLHILRIDLRVGSKLIQIDMELLSVKLKEIVTESLL